MNWTNDPRDQQLMAESYLSGNRPTIEPLDTAAPWDELEEEGFQGQFRATSNHSAGPVLRFPTNSLMIGLGERSPRRPPQPQVRRQSAPGEVRVVPATDRTREMRWIREHREQYADLWIALDGDRLLASGREAKEVLATARAKGVSRPMLVHMEPKDALPFGAW